MDRKVRCMYMYRACRPRGVGPREHGCGVPPQGASAKTAVAASFTRALLVIINLVTTDHICFTPLSLLRFFAYASQDSFSKYKPGTRLGKGAFGVVLNCTEVATKARFACKCVDVKALMATRDGANIERRLRNEISVMSYLVGHPNLVSLKDVYESGPDGQLFIVRARLKACMRGTGGSTLKFDAMYAPEFLR